MNIRSRRPIISPVITSRRIQPIMALISAGSGGRDPLTMGHSARLITSASDRRTRGGT